MGTEIVTRMLWQEMRYSLTRRAILDFIASTEACFVSWEIITLFTVYGMQAFIPLLFLNLIQKSYRAGFYRGISCPYAHFITFLSTRHDKEYRLTLKEMCIRIICQVFGGLWAYKLNQSAWNFYLTPMHWYQSYNTSYGNCLTFLNVSTSYGFLIEFGGTFVISKVSAFIYDYERFPTFPLNHHGRILANCCNVTLLVWMAFHYTGGFYHPVIASVRTYGCKGFFRDDLQSWDHFVVYWMGSTCGAVAAYSLNGLKLFPFCRKNK